MSESEKSEDSNNKLVFETYYELLKKKIKLRYMLV